MYPKCLFFQGDDDKFRFNDTSTYEGHLCQNGVQTWFCNGMSIMMSYSQDENRTVKFCHE